MKKGTFYFAVDNFCKEHNMKCFMEPSNTGDWQIRVEYKFLLDGFMYVPRTEIVHIKEKGNVANYWFHTIHNGRHRISGPGYPSYALFEQKPLPLSRICSKFLDDLYMSFKYYQPV